MEQQLQQERIVIENDDEIEIDLKDLVLDGPFFLEMGVVCTDYRSRDRILYQQVCNGAAI